MVTFFLPALAALSLSASGVAGACVTRQAATVADTSTNFTFAQWIEEIIADPSGEHLSPVQAVAAKSAAVSTHGVQKRHNCDYDWPRANATEAAIALTYLAGLGAAGVDCSIGENTYSNQTHVEGNSQLVSTKSSASAQVANCNDLARTGGLIFDSCWRSDNTVMGSEICVTNSLIQVNVLGL